MLKEKGYSSHILKRRSRKGWIYTFSFAEGGKLVWGAKKGLFGGGDMVLVDFELCGISSVFKGICMAKQCKSLTSMGSSIRLRNVVEGAGVEMTLPLYCLCFHFSELVLFDHERKSFSYRSSKLYYLRDKSNSLSLVKFQWSTVLY